MIQVTVKRNTQDGNFSLLFALSTHMVFQNRWYNYNLYYLINQSSYNNEIT